MKSDEQMALIVRGLATLPTETTYVEFKMNQAMPDEIGERISALSNMAALENQPFGYLVWGIDDKTHKFLGTTLHFRYWKKGNEDILAYWTNLLSPRLNLSSYDLTIDGVNILVLEIPAASRYETLFKKVGYGRIDSYTKNLHDYPELERRLWQKLEEVSPERAVAFSGMSQSEIEENIDLDAYFSSLSSPIPSTFNEKASAFVREGFLLNEGGDLFSVTTLGALLFARNLSSFPTLVSKLLRYQNYHLKMRDETMGRKTYPEGYALSFPKVHQDLMNLLRLPDSFHDGIREDRYDLPPIAIRECLGNLLIHQDLSSTGSPLVEIFSDRVEFSNPGAMTIDPRRVIDASPQPKNPELASFLPRINIGDTAGSGFDKIEAGLERYGLASMKVISTHQGTRVILYRHRDFAHMDSEDKLRSLYYHCALLYVSSMSMTNKTLRERFHLQDGDKYKVSRLLAKAQEIGLIKKKETFDKREISYVPYWA